MTELHETAVGAGNESWFRIDNAGKIYPAARRKNWTALFRVSVNLTEDVDYETLCRAQERTLARFPLYAVRLKKGVFWYYLEKQSGCPTVQPDVQNPCVRMSLRENSGFMFRVRHFKKTVALEVFHVLSDGSGGMSFLLTLVGEYLKQTYNVAIEHDSLVLDCDDMPRADEIEDAFHKFARDGSLTRKESNSYHINGTEEAVEDIHRTTAELSADAVLSLARGAGVTVTEYLAAAAVAAVDSIQRTKVHHASLMKPVKVGVPVNLRKFYETNTKRNFASYINVGIEPRLGEYSFKEIVGQVHHQMGMELTEKVMNAKFSTNVRSEKNRLLSFAPLFLKNAVLKMTFNLVGDRKTATTISNLGVIKLPESMKAYVAAVEFTVGPLSKNRVVCGAVTYGGVLRINILRTIVESDFEREFFRILVKQGLHVCISSNNMQTNVLR